MTAIWRVLVPCTSRTKTRTGVHLRRTIPANTISVGATLFFTLSTLALALANKAWIAGAVKSSAGLAWIGMLTSLNVVALHGFRSSRQRDGAIRWDVREDVAEPGRIVESFVVESWVERQRQHARVTHADEIDQQLLQPFHVGDRPPVVRHLPRKTRQPFETERKEDTP